MAEKSILTVEGKRLLEEELKRLIGIERPSVVQAIEVARALGDLKENSEYHAAKERQSFIEGRIQYLNAILAGPQVVNPKDLNYPHIVFGATVHLEDVSSGTNVKYQIVGTDEADINKGKINYKSPIGKALIGKSEGDEVQVATPRGNVSYEVIKVEYV